MPPKCHVRLRQDTTLAHAVTKYLANAAEVSAAAQVSTTRAVRRRSDLIPQDTPDYEKKNLQKHPKVATRAAAKSAKAFAAVKPTMAKKAKRSTHAKPQAPMRSRTPLAKNLKTAAPTRRRGRKGTKVAVEDGATQDTETSEAAGSPSESGSDRTYMPSEASSSEETLSSDTGDHDEDAESKGFRGATRARTKQTGKRATSTAGYQRRATKAERLCLACKLDRAEWPYCGLSGEAHTSVC